MEITETLSFSNNPYRESWSSASKLLLGKPRLFQWCPNMHVIVYFLMVFKCTWLDQVYLLWCSDLPLLPIWRTFSSSQTENLYSINNSPSLPPFCFLCLSVSAPGTSWVWIHMTFAILSLLHFIWCLQGFSKLQHVIECHSLLQMNKILCVNATFCWIFHPLVDIWVVAMLRDYWNTNISVILLPETWDWHIKG